MNIDVNDIIKKMSLKQKIGQLILGQAEGYYLDGEFKENIKNYPLGGYRINGKNILTSEQVRKFMEDIQEIVKEKCCGIEAILAADEEGGTLSVFDGLVMDFPGNMALGAAQSDELAYLQGNATAWQLSSMGINFDFAPVADVNLQDCNPVIGVRSFGDKEENVANLACAFMQGLNRGGVAGCAKHFPGHGNTTVDSHCILPINNVDKDTIMKTEIVPFSMLIHDDVDVVMVSHVVFPKLNGNLEPASQSYNIITNILRSELGFDGVVMSDDLEMQAITDKYGIDEAVLKFIMAGGDMALVNGSMDSAIKCINGLLNAVSSGIISEERIDKSVERILKLKFRIKEYRKDASLETFRIEKISEKLKIGSSLELLSEEISKKAITKIRDNKNILPLSREKKVLVLAPKQVQLTPADTTGGKKNELIKYIKRYNNDSDMISYSLERELSSIGIQQILGEVSNYDYVVLCSINCLRFSWQVKLMNKIKDIKPLVVIMLRDPYDVKLIPEDITLIAAYSSNNHNMKITCDMLYGEYKFKGVLPVDV